eukprot:scpid77875/ scgid27794/ Probable RNA-directed DNA polymerase from transposon X-element; Reverse transcriptase
MSKVMEAIVNQHITNCLEKHHVLSSRQFGFCKGLCTADILTKLHTEWSKTAGLGGAVRVLAIDIAGAFDKVSHPGLLHKASVSGLHGHLHGWLSSYLRDRRLQAVVSGQQSSAQPVQSGVPQGSILGPTLFLLFMYVNDREDHLPAGSELATYADDTTLYQCLSAPSEIADFTCSSKPPWTACLSGTQTGE